jgi:segregation and condensation protein A
VLELRDRARWYDVVRPSAEPWEVLSALLALLELARRGELRLRQLSPFASVLITRESTGQAA